VLSAIQKCQQAGLVVRIVTGDSVSTAVYVAQKCGILKGDDLSCPAVLDGTIFNDMIRARPDGPVCVILVCVF